jgi:putative flavoprotein involved in K+ transport
MEALRAGRETWLAGRDVGHVPFRIESTLGRLLVPFVFRVVFHRLLTVDTPVGRKARPRAVSHGGPLIRVKPKDLASAGVRRVGRVTGVREGLPVLEGGQVVEPANVVWCTGYHPGLSWVDLPVFGADGEPVQERGVAAGEPGLYFVGLHFLYALSSTMIHGVERDARRVVETIASRVSP